MRPENVVGVISDRGSREDAPIIQHLPAQPGLSYELNIQGFIDALQSALTNLTTGYSLRLRLDGVATLAMVDWNWAKEPQDGSESWTPDVRMHVASLSKIVTAIAMTKLLNHKGMSYDTPIIDFLPGYWEQGAQRQFDHVQAAHDPYVRPRLWKYLITVRLRVYEGTGCGWNYASRSILLPEHEFRLVPHFNLHH